MTAFVQWLGINAAASEFAFCTQHQNRHVEGTEALVGPFAQAMVLRSDVSGNPTFEELLGRVHVGLLETRARADVCGPFMRLSRFRVNFNFFPFLIWAREEADTLQIEPMQSIAPPTTLWFDLTFHATVIAGELHLLLWTNLALWKQSTGERWIREYAALLQRGLDELDTASTSELQSGASKS
jgi:non-ribosomal peptide synthetase component F